MEIASILWVAKSYTLPGSSVQGHSHPFFHMLCGLSGRADFRAGKNPVSLDQGTIVLVPNDVIHSYRSDGSEIFQYLEIKFVPERSLRDSLAGRDLLVSRDPLAAELFRKIVSEYEGGASPPEEVSLSYLSALLNLLLEPERERAPRESRCIDSSRFSPLSRRIVGCLEERYGEPFSLDDLAGLLDYNKTYLCKAFRDDTGSTILDVLNLIRIHHAAELITYSDLSLTQVAADCGFSSVSHFNRVFRKYVGITPGQCRKAYPDGILVGFKEAQKSCESIPDRFMRSVLAGKNY